MLREGLGIEAEETTKFIEELKEKILANSHEYVRKMFKDINKHMIRRTKKEFKYDE